MFDPRLCARCKVNDPLPRLVVGATQLARGRFQPDAEIWQQVFHLVCRTRTAWEVLFRYKQLQNLHV